MASSSVEPESEENITGVADKYNVETAEILANSALHLPVAQAAPIYEQLLSVFPTAAKFWKQYVEAYMAVNNDDATKQLFSRCLLICLQVPLWRCYIRFIRKVYEKKGTEGQEETRKAFDFMLSHVGSDISSGPIWLEYITFLKSLPALNAQEESQRMIAIRKAYQRAVVTPTHHVEQLWKDYENFENSVSRQLVSLMSRIALLSWLKGFCLNINQNTPVQGLYIGSERNIVRKLIGICLQCHQLDLTKGNPQRIDTASSNKRIIFTYEQCLMYLYHYPDIWYDYATWHAKSGSIDAAIKVFQRALKALPDSEMLRYAFAELEESRGAIAAAKKLYESLLTDSVNTTALAHIQFIRFLRRTEGVEAARKYFLDARKSPNFTYHVYVAYALMAFCQDKDPKLAHNVFEAGLKRFMHEPAYILEYADFLSRLNDDRNIRALFERALSSLPPEESIEVWKRFTQFEQMYGDLDSTLKVEQRRKEALSRTGEEGASALEDSLQDVVSRYSFMDLWPCSSKDLDHLVRQEWLVKNINKKVDKSALSNGPGIVDKGPSGLTSNSTTSATVIYPDTSQMVIYDPRQKPGIGISPSTTATGASSALNALSNPMVATGGGGIMNPFDEMLKAASPAIFAFLANLPAVEGPTPNVDIVLSICLQSDIPTGQMGKSPTTYPTPIPTGAARSASSISGSNKSHPTPSGSSLKQSKDKQSLKRKDIGQDDDETTTVQSQPQPRDFFRIRQMKKARGAASSQTGSASYGSAVSGDLSGSTG
ncbi:hypothetical protein CUMW_002210 [Citrus unshiu]|nr:hypothetical protein CUMW_002210 [Citrus unshiu]